MDGFTNSYEVKYCLFKNSLVYLMYCCMSAKDYGNVFKDIFNVGETCIKHVLSLLCEIVENCCSREHLRKAVFWLPETLWCLRWSFEFSENTVCEAIGRRTFQRQKLVVYFRISETRRAGREKGKQTKPQNRRVVANRNLWIFNSFFCYFKKIFWLLYMVKVC